MTSVHQSALWAYASGENTMTPLQDAIVLLNLAREKIEGQLEWREHETGIEDLQDTPELIGEVLCTLEKYAPNAASSKRHAERVAHEDNERANENAARVRDAREGFNE
jgi:hypothetical protein